MDDDVEAISNKQKFETMEQKYKKRNSTFNATDKADDIIDHSIEIESNKRMRNANVNPWTLRFIDKTMEREVSLSVCKVFNY